MSLDETMFGATSSTQVFCSSARTGEFNSLMFNNMTDADCERIVCSVMDRLEMTL